jgi:mannose-6-phosphate isomerase-like protein (cupin superfamily)
MTLMRIRADDKMFNVLHATRAAQAAVMTLRPGQDTGEVQNEHPKAEQWLYILSGRGTAVVGGRRVALRAGSLLLIPKHAPHQVRNSDKRRRLVTLNFYAPPAYTKSGVVRKGIR